MKYYSFALLVLLSCSPKAISFSPSSSKGNAKPSPTSQSPVTLDYSLNGGGDDEDSSQNFLTNVFTKTNLPLPNFFVKPRKKKILVAGATGQTGRLILQALSSNPNIQAIGGVRNTLRAERILSETRTVYRGFQIDNVPAIDLTDVSLSELDLVRSSDRDLKSVLKGVDSLVIATGLVTTVWTLGNPLLLAEKARAVDNVGACRLMDAAKAVGVTKIVLLSSILTNARGWGQTQAPGFVLTNKLGKVLDQKLEAEMYLRNLGGGVDYTIVRAAELKNGVDRGCDKVVISEEDTLNSGVVSRELVANLCVASACGGRQYSRRLLEVKQE